MKAALLTRLQSVTTAVVPPADQRLDPDAMRCQTTSGAVCNETEIQRITLR
ncbi:hypothetical protein [Stenotrophomonas terrae]|uniref:hypothetical protein n=1 Tax=Stenotrophomonas terrae TaxID=405446 RepID=UPI00137AD1B4|nr:hypothetical protein [Stenotrophomonas terrae]